MENKMQLFNILFYNKKLIQSERIYVDDNVLDDNGDL
jgi:hypothetical protein